MKVRITEKQLSKMLKRGAAIKKITKALDKEMNDLFWKVSDEADRLEGHYLWLEGKQEDGVASPKERRECRKLGKLISKLDSAQDKLQNVF